MIHFSLRRGMFLGVVAAALVVGAVWGAEKEAPRVGVEATLDEEQNQLLIWVSNTGREKIEIPRPGTTAATWTLEVWDDRKTARAYAVRNAPGVDVRKSETVVLEAGEKIELVVDLAVGKDRVRYDAEHLRATVGLSETARESEAALTIRLGNGSRVTSNLVNVDRLRMVDEKTAREMGEGLRVALKEYAAGHPQNGLPAIADKATVGYDGEQRLTVSVAKGLPAFIVFLNHATAGHVPVMEGSSWYITAERDEKGVWVIRRCGLMVESNL